MVDVICALSRPAFRLFVLLVLFGSVTAEAQTVAAPFTSNRPGIGDSEALVGRGGVQIEGGMQATGASPASDSRWTQTWGQLTIRLGLATRLELFTGWDGVSVERLRAGSQLQRVAGGNDLRVGAKLAILTEARHGLALTASPAWSFPVGAEAFTSSSNDGSLRLLLARSLPRDWSIGGNLLFTRTSDSAGRYWDNGVMVSLARPLAASVSAFVETSAVLLADRPDTWTMDAGVAWVAGPDLQWDVSAGHTFNDRGDEWFVSAGVTLRLRRPPM